MFVNKKFLTGNVQLNYHDLKRILALLQEHTQLLFENSKNKPTSALMMFVYVSPIYTAYYVKCSLPNYIWLR